MPDLIPSYDPEPWLQLRDPQVRALGFAVGSMPLLQAWPNAGSMPIELPDGTFWRQQLQRYWPRLLALDDNPRPLHHALQRHPQQRLGYYFEDLLAFWLQDDGWHEFKLIGQGIQLLDGRRTLGELDFLLENRDSGQIEHWEVCVKFYLGEGSLRPAEWVGLQRQDTLGRKLHHLQHRQFSTKRIQGLTIDHRRAVIKGRLFWPTQCATMDDAPDWLHPLHLRGTWQSRIPDALEPTLCWRRASRLEWLASYPLAVDRQYRPTYWSSGLYLGQDVATRTQQHLMLRLDTRSTPPPYAATLGRPT